MTTQKTTTRINKKEAVAVKTTTANKTEDTVVKAAEKSVITEKDVQEKEKMAATNTPKNKSVSGFISRRVWPD